MSKKRTVKKAGSSENYEPGKMTLVVATAAVVSLLLLTMLLLTE